MDFWIIAVVSVLGVVLALVAGRISLNKESETILRTKILSENLRYTGRLNGSFYTETTFMLYYTDGSHKAVTVKNGTMEYNSYMSKLEG